MVSGAGSGVCELTNQSRLGIRDRCLKETGAKTHKGGNMVLQQWTEN